MSLEESRNYDLIKERILASFNLGPEAYLRIFRSMSTHGSANYVSHLNNMKEIFRRYIDAAKITDFASFVDQMLKEQLLLSLPNEVRAFVHSKEPKCADDCARAADLSCQVTQIGSELNNYFQAPAPNGYGYAAANNYGNNFRQVALLWQRDRATRLSVEILQLRYKTFHLETRLPGLSCGIICVILRLAVFTQYLSVIDTHAQTDRRTDTRRRHA